ncbi:MAG: IS110 family transposase, partial [Sphingobacteriales bacterium]
GKNKMSVLNAVRNKIIHRIFAVIKNQTIYKNDLVLS